MGSINPLQLLIFPFVFLFALPLALFAGLTTILAFLVLFLRLFLAYFDVGIETVRYLVVGNTSVAARARTATTYYGADPTPPSSAASTSPPTSPAGASRHHRSTAHRRKRRTSLGSAALAPALAVSNKISTSGLSLDRDFEGVGGWRLGNGDFAICDDDDRSSADTITAADDADDQQWYNLHSRLEIPDHRRHHFRSQSGGAVLTGVGVGSAGLYLPLRSSVSSNGKGAWTRRRESTSPEGLRMTASPNSSRSRTPTAASTAGVGGSGGRPHSSSRLDGEEGGYFLPQFEMRKITV